MTANHSVFARYGAPMMVAMNLVWGGSYLVADIGLREMRPGALAAWRFLIASLLLLLVQVARGASLRIERRDIFPIAAIGGLFIAGSYLLSYHGILLDTSTDRAIVSPMEPVALAILGAVFLRERLKGRQWAGIAIACLGTMLLVARNHDGTVHSRQMIGQALMLTSFFAEGMYSIAGKPLLTRYRPMTLTVWAMGFATVSLFIASVFEGGLPAPPASAAAWSAVLFLAIPCTVIGYTLWYLVLEHKPAGELGAFIFLQPIVGIALGMLYRNERLTVALMAGALLVIGGVWMTNENHAANDLQAEPTA